MDCFRSVKLLKKNEAGITGIYEIKTQKLIRKCEPTDSVHVTRKKVIMLLKPQRTIQDKIPRVTCCDSILLWVMEQLSLYNQMTYNND